MSRRAVAVDAAGWLNGTNRSTSFWSPSSVRPSGNALVEPSFSPSQSTRRSFCATCLTLQPPKNASSSCSVPASQGKVSATSTTTRSTVSSRLKGKSVQRDLSTATTSVDSRIQRFIPISYLETTPTSSTSAVSSESLLSSSSIFDSTSSPDDIVASTERTASPIHTPKEATLALLSHLRNAGQAPPSASTIPIYEYDMRPADHIESSSSSNHTRSRSTPTPPPPIAYLPQSNDHHPNVLTGFLLQCIFLGASAIGLLLRKRTCVTQVEEGIDGHCRRRKEDERFEKRKEIRCDEIERVPMLNLLLSSHVEWGPEPTTEGVDEGRSKSLDLKLERVSNVVHVLARFSDEQIKPDSWTVLALLSFIRTYFSLSSSTSKQTSSPVMDLVMKEKNDRLMRAKNGLVEWAWQAFVGVESSMDAPLKSTLLGSFIDWVGKDARRDESSETLQAILDHAFSSLETLSQAELLSLGQGALLHQRTDIVASLLSMASLMDPRSRIKFGSSVISALAVHESWYKRGEVVTWVTDSILTSLRTYLIALEGSKLDSSIIWSIRKIVNDLMFHFSIETSLADSYSQLVILLLKYDRTALPRTFVLRVMRSLVETRHPRSAVRILSLLPEQTRSLTHYEVLLASHREKTSDLTWSHILLHYEPTLQTLSRRLSSHLQTHRHELALSDFNYVRRREPLNDLRALPIEIKRKWLKCYSKLLRIYIETKADISIGKLRRRIVDDLGAEFVSSDRSIKANLLLREVIGRPWEEGVEGKRGRKKGRVHLKRIRKVWDKFVVDPQGKEDFVMRNVALQALTKWDNVVDAKQLEHLAEAILQRKDGETVPNKKELEMIRKPAYAILIKGFEQRGAWERRRVLKDKLRSEVEEVRKRSLGKRSN